MNHRKRTPAGIIHNAQVIDNPRSMQLQVAHVPVVKAVDSCIAKVIKKGATKIYGVQLRWSAKKRAKSERCLDVGFLVNAAILPPLKIHSGSLTA